MKTVHMTSMALVVLAITCSASWCAEVNEWHPKAPILSKEFKVVSVRGKSIEFTFELKSQPTDDSASRSKRNVLVALPAEQLPVIRIIEASYELWSGDNLVESGKVLPASLENEIAGLLKIEPLGIVRYWRLGNLSATFQRMTTEKGATQVRIYPYIRFALDYPFRLESAQEFEDGFLDALQELPVLDSIPMSAIRLPDHEEPDASLWEDSLDDILTGSAIKVWTRTECPVSISIDEIRILLDNEQIHVDEIGVYCKGEPVPLLVDESDGSEKILFFAKESESPYSRESVYWLIPKQGGDPPHERFKAKEISSAEIPDATASIVPAILHLEEDRIFAPHGFRGETQGDYWFWSSLNDREPVKHNLALPHIVSETFTLRLHLGVDPAALPTYWDQLKVSIGEKSVRLRTIETEPIREGRIYEFESALDVNPIDATETKFHVSDLGRRKAQALAVPTKGECSYEIYLDWIEVEYVSELVMDSSANL